MQRWGVTLMVGSMMATIAFAVGPGGGGPAPGGCGSGRLIQGLALQDVDAAEEADLLHMREEEKLARDVYVAMDDLWGLRVFRNISSAEQRHMDAVLTLLDRYSISDPVGDNGPGVFGDATLQQLYLDLTAQGSISLNDALIVGATIEDLDIKDLQDALERTDNEDITTVYQNLMKGSRNHLRSFVALLSGNGIAYEPQFVSLADFEAIISTPHERGPVDAFGDPVDSLGCGNRRLGYSGGPGGSGF